MIRLRCRWPFEPWRCSCCGQTITGRAPASVTAGLACDDCLERGRRGEPFIPLTVRMVEPKAQPDERQVVAVSMREQLVMLESGETFDLAELPVRIAERGKRARSSWIRDELPDQLPASIVTCDRGMDLLALLDGSCAADSPLWQWTVGLAQQGAWRPEARSHSRFTFITPKPVRFGYASQRSGKRRAKGRARWYQLIDVHDFCELPNGWGSPGMRELLLFGIDLREWANSQQLPVLSGAGAFGSRLLRDARFGGGWRRKVPGATNRRIRRRLPGNHYQLLSAANLEHPVAHKWDQHAAHHHAALLTRFPHPDQLAAHGRFRTDPPRNGQAFTDRGPIRAGSRRWRELLDQPGMFTVGVAVPELVAIDNLQLPQFRQSGHHWQTLTSVEIEQLPRGVRLLDIWCCWTSPAEDDRLREYALWASQQLQRKPPGSRHWLKPALLAAYGMLAARPSRFRNAWKWCAQPSGMIGWDTPHGQLIGVERTGTHDREPQTANVLWRALIESRVRLESLAFARQLRGQGMRPIAIYADAVFATGRLGALRSPPPWRYDGEMHDLAFENPARYRSREETKLPGVPASREGRIHVNPRKGVSKHGAAAADSR